MSNLEYALVTFIALSPALLHLLGRFPKLATVLQRYLLPAAKVAVDVVEAPPPERLAVLVADLKAAGTLDEAKAVAVRLEAALEKRLAPKGPMLPPALGVMALALLMGCSAGPKVLHAVQLSDSAIVVAAPCLVKAYELDEKACLDDPDLTKARACVADVRARWKPVVDGFTELRDVRCSIEPAKCVGGAK